MAHWIMVFFTVSVFAGMAGNPELSRVAWMGGRVLTMLFAGLLALSFAGSFLAGRGRIE